MRHVSQIKGGRGGPQTGTGRVLGPEEGHHSGAGFQRAQKSLQESLAEVARVERYQARERQKEAGITNPVKTGFKNTGDAELDEALAEIWAAGLESKKLYVKLGKGLASLERADVVALGRLCASEIEALAPALAEGLTIRQAVGVEKSEI